MSNTKSIPAHKLYINLIYIKLNIHYGTFLWSCIDKSGQVRFSLFWNLGQENLVGFQGRLGEWGHVNCTREGEDGKRENEKGSEDILKTLYGLW